MIDQFRNVTFAYYTWIHPTRCRDVCCTSRECLTNRFMESTSSGGGARPEYVLGGRKRDEGNAYETVAHAACAAPEAEAQRTLGTLGGAVWLGLPEQCNQCAIK
ncbi:hypothetical protein HF086_016982 [Spodoptera exigua]|uniref:Uncharacterized protein n=1 Tax=Spodoptera exigua TaxID=7107 RepID=A0A922M5Y1_SPOEX|nr:hypothetical protein HF086_016982 [Spodoptera exigua]